MWNNLKGYRSFFMLVRVQVKSGFSLTIPIPLFLLDQTFEVFEDLAWLAEKLVLRWAIPLDSNFPNSRHFCRWTGGTGAPSQILKLCREIIWELRCYGKWRMVEVETQAPHHQGKVRVYVDFI